ncbi:MAG: multiheme c-type cytochrome [Bryobacteraceae bacterium]
MLLAVVPMLVCAQCHAAIVARYSATPMARTSGLVDAASEPSGEFLHSISGTRFQIAKSKNRLELEWKNHRQTLDFFIGSRRMGRSYGFIENGYFYQAPVGYYANRRLWDMAPGYENDREPDFNRPITADCLFCHASGARAVPGTINRYADVYCLRGVTCERCHGDASNHLVHPQKGNIVNPQNLAAAERDSICEQCHLAGAVRFPQPERRLVDFRPGQKLSDYLAVFVAGRGSAGIRVNSHAEALAGSRCRQASGQKLWCGTCHDPHGQPANYRAKCLVCHAPQACPVARSEPRNSEADCVGCHMPKGRAYDGGHTVFTDHSIPRRAPHYPAAREKPGSLARYYPAELASSAGARNLGIAWAQVAEDYAAPELFEKAWPLLRAAAGRHPRDPLLYTTVAEALESASRTVEAKKVYQLSLEQDPVQVNALLRLAMLFEHSGDSSKAAALRKRAVAILPRLSRETVHADSVPRP